MKWIIPFTLFFILIKPFNGQAEEIIKKGETLNLETMY